MSETKINPGTFLTPARTLRLVGVIILVIFLLVALGLFAGDAAHKASCTEKVEAVVIDYVTSEGDSGETYAPLFSYSYGGIDFKSAGNVYTNPPSYKKGETAEIFIDPDNPHKVYVPTGRLMFITEASILGVGAFVFVLLFFIMPAVLHPKEILVSYVDSSNRM